MAAPDAAIRMENQLGTSVNFEKFTWTIEDFSKQNAMNLRSKAFKIRGYTWRILVYPLAKDVNHFSLYLMVADSLPPYGWSRNTFFKLALVNQVDRKKSVVKETHQKFKGGHCSWGSLFLNLSDFYDLKQGYLVKDTCIIEAHVCVSDFAPKIQDNNLKTNLIPSHDSKLGDQTSESSDQGETLSLTTSSSSPTEGKIQGSDLALRDLIDLEALGPEEEAFVPLLEEACTWHPSLIQSQRKRSHWFRLWAFTSLGQVLHFLKTKKVKYITENDCEHLKSLWEELVKSSGFDLAWVEPYVQSALGVKAHLERSEQVKKLQDNVVALELKMKKLRGELAAAQVDFEVARKGLSEARKVYQEMDMNGEIGYAMF